jgi:hypothetical protein
MAVRVFIDPAHIADQLRAGKLLQVDLFGKDNAFCRVSLVDRPPPGIVTCKVEIPEPTKHGLKKPE